MSSGPENRFIQSIHRILPANVYRMKNHNTYNSGIADCWYSGLNGDLWVEYKFLSLLKRPLTIVDLVGGNKPVLSALQQNWLSSRSEEGRRVGVIIGTTLGGVWFPGTDWMTPLTTAELRSRIVPKQGIAALIAGLCLD